MKALRTVLCSLALAAFPAHAASFSFGSFFSAIGNSIKNAVNTVEKDVSSVVATVEKDVGIASTDVQKDVGTVATDVGVVATDVEKGVTAVTGTVFSPKDPVTSILGNIIAGGSDSPITFIGGLFGQSATASFLQQAAVDLAISLAKANPIYNAILSALGINTAQDVQNFLIGNDNGVNFKNILSYLIFQYTQENPSDATWLNNLGINSQAGIAQLLQGGDFQTYENELLQMAFSEASTNKDFSQWTSLLSINNASDLEDILNGNVSQGNLHNILLQMGLNYLASSSQYAEFVPLISMLLNLNSSTDMSTLDMGVFAGLTPVVISAISGSLK